MAVEGIRRATLRWGIVLGVVAVLLPLLSRPIIVNFGTETFASGSTSAALLLTLLLTALPTILGMFSAALVGAALVMRHAELVAPAVAPASGQQHTG